MRRLREFLCLCAISCLVCCACGNSESSYAPPQRPLGIQPLAPQNTTEVSSNITKSVSSLWSTSIVRVSGQEALDSVFFLDKTHGWVAGEGALYKLVDN